MKPCARCGISDDGHSGSSILTGHPPHPFVTWSSPWQRQCRARHASWNVRCELPRRHEGSHLAERGMDTPEWIEVSIVNGSEVPPW